MEGIMLRIIPLALAVTLVVPPAIASDPLELTRASFHEIDSLEKSAQGRPNEEHRIAGLKAYVRGDHARAAGYFETAAHYADKFSQHALSLMHWHGVGVPVDRVEAYVWSDLAAERGTRKLLAIRERMWQELAEDERSRAREIGESFYARYGDDVAKPRAEGAMRRFATTMTGSRVGFDSRPMEVTGKPTSGSFFPEVGTNSGSYMASSFATPEALYGGTRRDLSAYWIEQERQLVGRGTASGLRDVRVRRPHAGAPNH